MLSLSFGPSAVADLDAIYDFIVADKPGSALSYIEAIQAHCLTLCDHPRLGRSRDDLGPGIRIYPMRRQVVVAYRILPGTISVRRVFHGGRDYGAVRIE